MHDGFIDVMPKNGYHSWNIDYRYDNNHNLCRLHHLRIKIPIIRRLSGLFLV
jgi:hypothetical protein